MPSRNPRRIRYVAAALLALGLAAWLVPSYFSAERYRHRLQAGLERTLHRPVKFGALSFHLLPRPGFSIENAEVDEDTDFGSEPFARIDHIDCDLRWHSLWRSRMDFAHLQLDRPSFNIVLNSQGKWNVENLLVQSGVTAPRGAGAEGKPAVETEQLDLEVEDARINFQVGPNKKPFALTDVGAHLQINPAERRVRFQITASPLRSDLPIPTPGPVELTGEWTPGADLHGPIDARLRTQGALLYDWIPVVTGTNPQVYGVMDSDVRLTGSLPDLQVEGETRMAQLHRWGQLPPSDSQPWTFYFRGRLMNGRERILIESLEASFRDSHLHLSGSVDSRQSTPQLDLVVTLERSRLEDLLAAARRWWPISTSWNLKGRIDAMLAIQGPWKEQRYGGFLGARQVSLETPSGSFPISDVAVRINRHGATLEPIQIALAPRVLLEAQGTIERTKLGPRYEMQLAARGVPLHQGLTFVRDLGIHFLPGIDATGSGSATMNLTGAAWPPARPMVSARAELRAVRLLIPGLTEPLNLPRASLEMSGNQITVDPVVAVLGTSLFTGKLLHRGSRSEPWMFDLSANNLKLEEAALWFDSLGVRRPMPLLERLPGLASFAARREAASQIFARLNALGRFATPVVTYRGVTLKDFRGSFEVAGRAIRMKTAAFRAAGGRGEAEGSADFTIAPPPLSARVVLTNVPVSSLTARLAGPAHSLQGSLNAVGSFETRGLTHEELAANLRGRMEWRIKGLSFGDFDPLASLAQVAHWGKLEPARSAVTAPSATVNVQIRDRRFILDSTALDFSGASLQVGGTYAWSGDLNLNVRADLRHLRRRWIDHDEDPPPVSGLTEVRLTGMMDHLAISPQDRMASVVGNQ